MELRDLILPTVTLLSGGGLVKLLEWWTASRGGATARLRNDFDKMTAERDQEAARRRRLQESLSEHRRIIIEAQCLTEKDLPKWPG